MDPILQVKEALAARSRTTTLEDLRSQGRRLVKVIRTEHIAAMVQEAVAKAVEASGAMSREEVDMLVERSQQEFKGVLAEREQQAAELERVTAEAKTLRKDTESLREERDRLRGRCEEAERSAEKSRQKMREATDEAGHLGAALEETKRERDALKARLAELENLGDPSQLGDLQETLGKVVAERDRAAEDLFRYQTEQHQMRSDLDRARSELEQAHARLAELESAAPASSGGGEAAVALEIVGRLMQEVAELKAGMGGGSQADAGLAAMLEKLTGKIDERLDKLGRKMGVSSAVEAPDVKLGGLFAHDGGAQMESNVDSLQSKQTQGTGIRANLERLRKLKGEG